jgi:hypothetical protein
LVVELTGTVSWKDVPINKAHTLPSKNQGVLAELGRILYAGASGRTIANLATQILEMKPRPKSKEIVRMLRRWRFDALGRNLRRRAGDAESLAEVIDKAIDEYMNSNTATPFDTVVAALELELGMYMWLASDPEVKSLEDATKAPER